MRKTARLLLGLMLLMPLDAGVAAQVAASNSADVVMQIGVLGRGWVNDLAWSPDNKRLAVASATGIWLYDAADLSAQPQLLLGHTEPVSSVAFSPDGSLLVSGSWDHTLRLWDTAAGTELAILEGHNSAVESVAFSPDGRTIASGSGDTLVYLWDVETGALQREIHGHENSVTQVVFSPDGRYLASGSRYDHQLTVLWTMDGEQRSVLQDMGALEVQGLAFSPDSRLLAAVSGDGRLRMWDSDSGELKFEQSGQYDVAFQPVGTLVASAGSDGVIEVWDSATGEMVKQLLGSGNYSSHLAFSADGNRLASTSNSGDLSLWDMETGVEIATLRGWHSGGVNAVGFGADGAMLVTGGGDAVSGPGAIILWDVDSRTQRAVLPEDHGNVQSLAVSPDGASIVVGTEYGVLEFRDGATGQVQQTVQAHQGRVLSVVFSNDGSVVASGGDDASARLWDSFSAETRAALTDLGGPVRHLNLSDDGNLLPSSGLEDITKLADLDKFSIACTTGDGVTSMLFSPDKRYVASAYWNNKVNLVDLESGELHVALEGHTGIVWSIAFSPDSQLIATGGVDRSIRLWNATTGEALAILEGHTWDVTSLAFSPDGSLLASGSGDGTVRLWQITPA